MPKQRVYVIYVDDVRQVEYNVSDEFDGLDAHDQANELLIAWFKETDNEENWKGIPEDERESANDWGIQVICDNETYNTRAAVFVPYRGETATVTWFY